MNLQTENVFEAETQHFGSMAADWWNPKGACRPLHELNPARLRFITERMPVFEKRILDLGCGGGILSEALARQGALVMGVDACSAVIEVAKEHALMSQLAIDYRAMTLSQFLEEHPDQRGYYDAVVCFELLEHVPEPEALIREMVVCLRPGGQLFLSTLNRTPKAFLTAILGAEYVLRLLPKGTHRYAQFIRPSELERALRQAGCRVLGTAGLSYHPWSGRARLSSGLDVNYLMHAYVS